MASVMSTDQGEAGLFPHVVIFRCDDVIAISVAAMRCQFVRDPGRAESTGGGDQGSDGGGGAARLGQEEWEHVSRVSLDNKMVPLPVFTLIKVTLGICRVTFISIQMFSQNIFAFLNGI